MAVRQEATIKRYTGLSTDPKPEPYTLGGKMGVGELLPPGSVFYELDTGREFRWDGGLWFSMPDVPEILREQRDLLRTAVQTLEALLKK